MTTPAQQAREAQVEKIMELAQCFASTWSLVGGQFDNGELFNDSQATKEELRRAVIEAISAEPQQPAAPEWIAVSDRLPEPFTEVLVYPRPTDYCCEAQLSMDGIWKYTELDSCGANHINCSVTHWSPLPPAPKAQS